MFSINSCCVLTKTTPVTSVSGWRREISIGRCPTHWHRTCGRDRQYGDCVCSFAPTVFDRSEVSTPCETGEKNLAGARGQEVNISVKLLAVQVHCSESTQQWWTNETLSIRQQLLFIATQCCRLNCRNAQSCTRVDSPFYESVQRKRAQRCTKVCALFEVAVELSRKWQPVHYRGVCTSLVHYRSIIAATTVQRCTVMLSQCCNIINTTYTLTVYAEAHRWKLHHALAHYRSRNGTLLHYHAISTLQYCTIMLSRYCHNVLSQSSDLPIVSNRAFIATPETFVAATKYV